MSGIGLPSASTVSRGAYIGSLLQTKELQKQLTGYSDVLFEASVNSQIENLPEKSSGDRFVFDDFLKHSNPQKLITSEIQKGYLNEIVVNASPRQKSQIAATMGCYSGQWLLCIPIASLGLHMSSKAFRASLQHRLGLPIFRGNIQRCPLCPAGVLDEFGDHAAGCKGKGHSIIRHNQMRDKLFEFAQMAQLGPVREPLGLLPNDPGLRPADILLPGIRAGGKDLCIDVSVCDAMQNSLQSNPRVGQNGRIREALKIEKYRGKCDEVGLEFDPFVVDTYGGFSEIAKSLVYDIGSRLAFTKDLHYNEGISRVSKGLAFTLQHNIAKRIVEIIEITGMF